jgi:flavin-dependent dehydrogenase
VEVFPGTNVTDIKKAGNTVKVETDKRSFEGTFVIAADGINSRIARILGLNKERTFTGTQVDVSWVVEGEMPVDPGSFNFILAEKGTFYVMPSYKKDSYHVRFTKEDKTYASWFKNVKMVGRSNSVVNELSPIKEPFKDNVLLVGDAAWIRELSNMAALCSGWQAGQAIALALFNNKFDREGLASYLKWWEEDIYGPHGQSELAAGEFQDFLSADEIDYLVSLVEKPLPATMDFYTFFGQIGRTYAELFPKIEEERPEVMAKLFEMRSNMDEVMQKQRKAGFPNR